MNKKENDHEFTFKTVNAYAKKYLFSFHYSGKSELTKLVVMLVTKIASHNFI